MCKLHLQNCAADSFRLAFQWYGKDLISVKYWPASQEIPRHVETTFQYPRHNFYPQVGRWVILSALRASLGCAQSSGPSSANSSADPPAAGAGLGECLEQHPSAPDHPSGPLDEKPVQRRRCNRTRTHPLLRRDFLLFMPLVHYVLDVSNLNR